MATARRQLELQIAELERQSEEPAERLAGLRCQYTGLQAKQERVTAASRRLMAEIDAFRAGKDATSAAYTAARQAPQAVWAELDR